jgi:hypothetical protein
VAPRSLKWPVGASVFCAGEVLTSFRSEGMVSAETAAMLALSFNIANIALRFTTTTPVGAGE